MIKLLGIIALGLLLSGCSKNKEANFKCINEDGKEREYLLSINLKDKTMMRASVPYEIVAIDEEHISAINKNNQYENKIIFNRHTGDLYFVSWKKNENVRPTDTASYKCVKSEKLI